MISIYHRRSVRSFQSAPVPEESLREIVRAGMAAPSAVNARPWEFYIVQDPALCEKLAAVSPYAWPAAKAPAVIVPVYHTGCKAPEYAQIDMALCTQNMMLMADELGLGSVCLGIAPEPERMQAVHELLNLPQGQECFCLLPVGVPENAPEPRDTWDESRLHFIG